MEVAAPFLSHPDAPGPRERAEGLGPSGWHRLEALQGELPALCPSSWLSPSLSLFLF